MSGVAGADRVKSREDFKQFLTSYRQLISRFPGFVDMKPSGSYNSDPNKTTFGDIDLIVYIQTDQDKKTLKAQLAKWLESQPASIIMPFASAKYPGRRTYNSGEIVSVRYQDKKLGYSAQIDNIIAIDDQEADFKMQFLDMPAAMQGLVLGLIKVATIETPPRRLFQRLNITVKDQLDANQEWSFNLSSVELQLRKITYDAAALAQGEYKEQSREVVWRSNRYTDVKKLLGQWDLSQGFEHLLAQTKTKLKNPRSKNRIRGVFQSMVHVTSGEVGTEKGQKKQSDIDRIQKTLAESNGELKQVVVQPGGYHPFHAGHLALWRSAQQAFPGADFYIIATDDVKTRPFPFEVKQRIAELSGVKSNQFVKVKSPFNPVEIKQQYDPETTQLIFVRSEKDRNEPPIPGTVKKDGSPSKLQPWGHSNLPMSKHEYIAYLPTVKFDTGAGEITSASELRDKWPTADNQQKTHMVQSVYPHVAPQAQQEIKLLLNRVLTDHTLAEASTVQFHQQLNPALWQRNQMLPEVREHLMRIAKTFYAFLDLPKLRVKDVTVSGSNAGYTYTPQSDVDLHLIVRVKPSVQQHMRKYVDAKKIIFNQQHTITVNDQPVEVYVQFEDQPHASDGIFSVARNRWVQKPQQQHASIDTDRVNKVVRMFVNQIRRVIRRKDLPAANQLMKKISQYRKQGLANQGQFSVANTVFKQLRQQGYLDRLTQFRLRQQDWELSLEEDQL
jgi:predicted nucleotidyltransferase